MTCQDIRAQLSALIDDALAPAARRTLDAHLATCAECRRELAGLRETVGALARLGPVRAPAGFVDRVMAAAFPRPWYRRLADRLFVPMRLKLPLEAAAVLLVAASAVYLHERTPEVARLAREAAEPSATPPGATTSAAREAGPPGPAGSRGEEAGTAVAPGPAPVPAERPRAVHGPRPVQRADAGRRAGGGSEGKGAVSVSPPSPPAPGRETPAAGSGEDAVGAAAPAAPPPSATAQGPATARDAVGGATAPAVPAPPPAGGGSVPTGPTGGGGEGVPLRDQAGGQGGATRGAVGGGSGQTTPAPGDARAAKRAPAEARGDEEGGRRRPLAMPPATVPPAPGAKTETALGPLAVQPVARASGRLVVTATAPAEAALDELLPELGATRLGRRAGGPAVVVELLVPAARYTELAAALARIGRWEPTAEPSAGPGTVQVELAITTAP